LITRNSRFKTQDYFIILRLHVTDTGATLNYECHRVGVSTHQIDGWPGSPGALPVRKYEIARFNAVSWPYGQVVPDFSQDSRFYSGHTCQVVDRTVRAILRSIADNALGSHRSNAGHQLKLLGSCSVQVYFAARGSFRGCGPSRRCACLTSCGRRSRLYFARRWTCRLADLEDRDMVSI
jgi:hypothetical protein